MLVDKEMRTEVPGDIWNCNTIRTNQGTDRRRIIYSRLIRGYGYRRPNSS